MTIREEIRARIACISDDALPDLLEHIERFERRRELPLEFSDALREVRQRNRDLSEDEALGLATEAVTWARRLRER